MDHAFYVYTSWGAAIAVVAAIIVWTLADGRIQRAEIARLEKLGIRRRSEEG